MTEDAGQAMKARLRADLLTAVKGRRTVEAKVIRALVAAIDNAEAPPVTAAGTAAQTPHDFHGRTAEIERLRLSPPQVLQVLQAEVDERERAATELDRLEHRDRAEILRAEAHIARRYLA